MDVERWWHWKRLGEEVDSLGSCWYGSDSVIRRNLRREVWDWLMGLGWKTGRRKIAEARITRTEWATLSGMKRNYKKKCDYLCLCFFLTLCLFVFFVFSSRAKRSPKQRRRHQINGSPIDAEKDRLITTDSDGTYKRPPGVNNSAYIVCMSLEWQEGSDGCNGSCDMGRIHSF